MHMPLFQRSSTHDSTRTVDSTATTITNEKDDSANHALLQAKVREFCEHFVDCCNSAIPPAQLVTEYFSPTDPQITEHGPAWAKSRLPYIGTWSGLDDVIRYWTLLAQTIDFTPGGWKFPSNQVEVDQNGEVSVEVVGNAKFRALATGREFCAAFRMKFSGFDGEGRIGRMERWGDNVVAYTAAGSERGTTRGG